MSPTRGVAGPFSTTKGSRFFSDAFCEKCANSSGGLPAPHRPRAKQAVEPPDLIFCSLRLGGTGSVRVHLHRLRRAAAPLASEANTVICGSQAVFGLTTKAVRSSMDSFKESFDTSPMLDRELTVAKKKIVLVVVDFALSATCGFTNARTTPAKTRCTRRNLGRRVAACGFTNAGTTPAKTRCARRYPP
ncbi:uncharacterized protein DSM5745_07174 [Aspergillus mulundensis]|uniref:Uncharacterized protein n=1 Tax=Aspergillus mulundensis TaxID=1810919 RepID=A0A3D8RKC7_9EURO|nr:hypothetical protein DSM5745_07174 [Aspergillus mulundensis]RDW74512.1 hypothetical protein DSM5745_07174 [Aspergillus mulundensis]